MFDLSKLDLAPGQDAGAEMTVLHPVTREPVKDATGATVIVTVRGAEGPEFQAIVTKSKGGTKEGATAVVARLVTGWSGVALDGDSALPYSHENAVKLLDRLPWLAKDVIEFAQDRANFFPA